MPIIIQHSDESALETLLVQRDHASEGFHFTNGTYMAPAALVVPTTVIGFGYISETLANKDDAFVIAINSDVSMHGIMDKKNATEDERKSVEDQVTRAMKVAGPLSEQNPDKRVFVIFYDEETPTALYDLLAEGGINMASLHKWGYGTNPDAPKIEGAHNFSHVFGFPMPNDIKPVCYDITVSENQSDIVKVVNLKDKVNAYNNAASGMAGVTQTPSPKGP